MNNLHRLPDRDDGIEDQAAQWVFKLERGLSGEEEAALAAWMTASADHTRALVAAAETWERMDILSSLEDLFPVTQVRGGRKKKTTRRLMPMSAIAATLLLVLSATSYYFYTETDPAATVDVVYSGRYETAVGEFSSATLPDGSELVLNTDSQVEVNFYTQRRHIELLSGELHLQVAHDTARPLVVGAGDKLVRAVGTAFNLELRADARVELIVTDGRVLVGNRPDTATNMDLLSSGDTEALAAAYLPVARGESVVLGAKRETVQQMRSEDIDVLLAWRRGKLIFTGETLQEAIDEISRYTAVTFEIVDPGIKDKQVVGVFRAGDVKGLLATLDQNLDIASHNAGKDHFELTAK